VLVVVLNVLSSSCVCSLKLTLVMQTLMLMPTLMLRLSLSRC
jgi:hypothetical protein